MDDEQIENDAEWLRSIVDRHSAPLLRYAASILRDPDNARDVVQETFVRLWREPRGQVEARVVPWLFRVCRNRALDYRRKEKRMTPIETNPAAPPPADTAPDPGLAAETRDSHDRVLQFMATLPENQREVVRLKFQNGLSYKEIAEVTDLSVGNVGFLLHTALKTLRTRLVATGE